MKKLLLSITLILSITFLNGQDIDLSKIDEKLGIQIEKILLKTGAPSISYAIFGSDSILSANAFGYSNVALKTPATEKTIYNTGSTFKVITSMGVMKLHASEMLDIDKPIADYLSGAGYSDFDKDTPVTIRHLLSHRSGLSGETVKIPLWDKKLPKPLDSLFNGIKPYQKPGLEFKYCNHCYGIAGYIIQNTSGQSYIDYMKESILDGFSLTDSNPFKPTPRMMEQMALPYNLESNIAVPIHYYRYNVYPAGDAYLTPSDMAKLLIPQLNDGYYKDIQILDSNWVNEMQKDQFTSNNYGLGIGVTVNNEGKLLLHGGTVPGFSAYYILDIENKKGVYFMSNSGNIGDVLLALSNYAILLLRGEHPDDRLPDFAKKTYNEITLKADVLKIYEGRYKLAPELFVEVFLEKQSLFIQVSGQSKVRIYPSDINKFFLKLTDAQITFNLNNERNVESLTLYQNSKSINGQKIR